MARLSCTVGYRGIVSASVMVTKTALQRALKETWSKIGWHMFEKFVEKHFTKEGAAEYRNSNATGDGAVYQARSGEGESGRAFWKSYNGRKQKRFGQQLAMVFKGNTRDGAKRATVYATSKGVRVAMPGLVHLNQYKPPVKKHGPHAGEPAIDLRRDMLAISRKEQDEIQNMHERLLTDAFDGKLFDYNYQVSIKP